jgi:hypothetical protein
MEITTKESGKKVELTVFQGKMFAEIKGTKIHDVAEIVNLTRRDGTKGPAIKTMMPDGKTIAYIPLTEEQEKAIDSWYDALTSEEACACIWNHVTK